MNDIICFSDADARAKSNNTAEPGGFGWGSSDGMHARDGGMGRVQSRRKVWWKRCLRSGVAMLQTSVDSKILVSIVWADRKTTLIPSSSLMVSAVSGKIRAELVMSCHGRSDVASESLAIVK